ncbi:hypothetical protein O181_000536 [Austropuccinia psidii MF-1]|uniref:Uncharacterized protein n=1 Tax=Austropuccinia psidii MF-1 TaxID=1389203 RepID=A0A9Q3B994_9BASI|nr:hypothetical protein [Austropuccinia psidii MF-1]
MSNSKRYKSNYEGSDRLLHEPIEAVLHGVKGQELGNVATNPPRSDELLAHPEKVPQWGTKDWHKKKREERKDKAPVASNRKPQEIQPLQEGKKNKKKNWRKPYSPNYRIPRIQKDAMENFLNMARALMQFKEKEEQRMRQPSFPKK